MTGPEHYREAEERLRASDYQWQQSAERGGSLGAVLGSLREALVAEVHATLALTAATLDAAYGQTSIPADEEWSGVTSS